jgi:hypothetical protein
MKIHNHEKCHSDHAEKQHSFFNSIKKEWKNYKPLIIIVVFCFILPVTQDDLGNQHYMYSFMGYFFIFFSLFKFFNLKGFIDGFSTYDLVTKRFRVYGYAYPFIEFLLGVAYLSKLGACSKVKCNTVECLLKRQTPNGVANESIRTITIRGKG